MKTAAAPIQSVEVETKTAKTKMAKTKLELKVSLKSRRFAFLPFAIVLALAVIAIPAAQSQTFTLLHEFTADGDGIEPASAPLLDPTGTLYGVTSKGGSFNYGTIYRIDSATKEAILHSFLGGEGLDPLGGLIRDAQGNFYGTTVDGGMPEGGGCAHGCGTVFKRDSSGNQSILYAFTGTTDGGAPNATLLRDAAGNFYGTTDTGGLPSCFISFGCGVIFKLDAANHETVLYRFTDLTDGKDPVGLVADASGNLYGTTYDGGIYGAGAVFKLAPSGTLTTLHSFSGGADSNNPNGHLIIDKAGNIYGTTNGGLLGSHSVGNVFKIDPAGNFTALYTFTGGADGSYPNSVVMDASGNLYAVAYAGGTGTGCYYGSCGLVFKLDPSGNRTILHSFSGTDGQLPNSLTIDSAGNLYGTTLGGGKVTKKCSYYAGCGTVFKLTP